MEYNFKEIEAKWQSRWRADKTYKVETDPSRPKFYVLDRKSTRLNSSHSV